MRWRLVYTERAARDVKSLDPVVRARLGRALRRLEDDPVRSSKRLTQPSLGTYRFRVGDYRVIFDISGSNLVILRVGHRASIHR